jgi:spore coat protein CotH
MYVPVTVEHDGRVWTNVGMRYKGNSSLTASVGLGNGKVPFRLNFDRYEEESPEIQNQRFYGFQEMTFSSNFGDDSQLREVLANEVFRDRGVPAPRAAFYRVYVDTGSGPQYWGLYTMVEDPADGSMLQAQFRSRSGNLYKPDGPGADWTRFDPAGFEKKNNEDENDFGDVRAAIEALHARTAPEAWRAELERTFDVDLFLRWLAVNSTISNWDAYGALAHNYYLYGDPAQGGRLRWIPWDNNFAFAAGPGAGFPGRGGFGPPGGRGFPPGGGFGPPGGRGGFGPPPGRGGFGGRGGFPGGGPADVLHRQVGAEWPLIQRLLADPVYQARYRAELDRAVSGLMSPAAFERRARELHRLVTSSVVGPQGERPTHTTVSSAEGFQGALDGADGLIAFVAGRERAVRDALRPAPAQ